MKIAFYCQYVLGIGHFFRSLEVCRALEKHEVILITGGPRVDVPLPSHVREFRLPGLMMDAEFSRISAAESDQTVEQIKHRRRQQLYDLFHREAPDVFIVELYPFGRKAFRFELDPVLQGIRNQTLHPCRIVCSLRDILVEKKDAAAYERRVVSILNQYFDALLIHSDPQIFKLDETFAGMDRIDIPVAYTGFIAPKPAPDSRDRIRKQLGVKNSERLIVASAGGGKVGFPLLEAVVRAFDKMSARQTCCLYVFAGPFMSRSEFERLNRYAGEQVHVRRFAPDFLDHLAAADLSVSMAGYNTCMNILAAGVPALVWPFMQNREQRMRAEELARLGALQVLDQEGLDPVHLAARMDDLLSFPAGGYSTRIDLNGAENTAARLDRCSENEGF